MSGRLVASASADGLFPTVLTVDSFRGIIEGIEAPVLVADRKGLLLAANGAAKAFLGTAEPLRSQTVNIFENLFRASGAEILEELATGRAWAEREIPGSENGKIARFRMTPEPELPYEKVQKRIHNPHHVQVDTFRFDTVVTSFRVVDSYHS